MIKHNMLNFIAIVAILFGAVTVYAGEQALFGNHVACAAVGNAVPFVLWFNSFAGFVCILAGVGRNAAVPVRDLRNATAKLDDQRGARDAGCRPRRSGHSHCDDMRPTDGKGRKETSATTGARAGALRRAAAARAGRTSCPASMVVRMSRPPLPPRCPAPPMPRARPRPSGN